MEAMCVLRLSTTMQSTRRKAMCFNLPRQVQYVKQCDRWILKLGYYISHIKEHGNFAVQGYTFGDRIQVTKYVLTTHVWIHPKKKKPYPCLITKK